MESRMIEIKSKYNSKIKIGVIPGHFATNHSHVNYYVDLTKIKTHQMIAKETGKEIAKNYLSSHDIDTIVCLEGTEIIGAFLADELSKASHGAINSGKDIAVITPETNANNQMIFRDNIQKDIYNKRVLLLIASVSTGKTINRSVECLEYYSGQLAGVAAIFSAIHEYDGIEINSIFTADDMTNYESMPSNECKLCKAGKKVDAIVNSFGYSKL